ncbi:hypothetical protein BRADI_4g11635v3 [Brachypodium distachyon]|uniref:Uncharacterized protein n=1 Tax=Brachypodium distachyon TaxID=15368 RepID=I1IJU0_BRADI|nr:hypothetical protein BRADI_4g11635v3 [Brachypodium distachyon]
MSRFNQCPKNFSKWLMRCYNLETSELVISGRGSIPVDAESVQRVFDLPNKWRKVTYEMNQEATLTFLTSRDWKTCTILCVCPLGATRVKLTYSTFVLVLPD